MKSKDKRTQPIAHSIFTGLLVCLIAVMIAFMCFFSSLVFSIKHELSLLQNDTSNIHIESSSQANSETYINHYVELSQKADAEMERMVSVVGILATVYTIFGALIVFKAPHEIDKRIGKLDKLITESNEAAQEAKYQSEIIDAVVNNYNGKLTNYDKLRGITRVIDRYPTKPDAYIQRGFIYDDMKKYDEAIGDYKIGLKYGGDKSSYYGNIAIAFNKKREYKKALTCYTKAIKLDPTDAIIYANRGSCYDDIKEYELAMEDYNKAIEIDDDCKEAYINRSITYYKQIESESEKEKKEKLFELMISDLHKALEIDPEDMRTRNMLRKRLNSVINPDEIIAKIDEEIADLELENKNIFSSFKHYIGACCYYFKQMVTGNEVSMDDIKRLISKIFDVNKEDIIEDIPQMQGQLSMFCQVLRSLAVNFYLAKEKGFAEKSFLLLHRYDDSKSCLLNLAFMKRRGETQYTDISVTDLLNISQNTKDAIWCTNKALSYVSGVDQHEVNWEKAVEVMNSPIENLNDALEWWNNIEIVGSAENNMAMILFSLCKNETISDDIPISERVKKALTDGYIIPPSI